MTTKINKSIANELVVVLIAIIHETIGTLNPHPTGTKRTVTVLPDART